MTSKIFFASFLHVTMRNQHIENNNSNKLQKIGEGLDIDG